MPASLTRTCATCGKDKPTGVGFREPGDVTRGRPPKTCVECRAKIPALRARHADNVARRSDARARQRAYARRHPAEIARATHEAHPWGLKVCPEVSGCGQALPLFLFRADPYQADGLAPYCRDCADEAAWLRLQYR